MNRSQIPGELKATICRQIASGTWSKREAVEISTYSVQTLTRWLERYAAEGAAAFAPKQRPKRDESRPVAPELRQVLDEALKRAPKLRTRSLTAYVQRHYGWKVPRRLVAVYLAERGLVEPAPAKKMKRPVRRFEAPAPLDLVQVDIVYVPRSDEDGWLYAVNVLDDHSRVLLGSTALEQQTGKNVLEAFREVVARWGRPNRVLTDRGTQFVHWRGRTRFQDYVEKELKAEHILAAAKHPQTLGKLERFHRSLEDEGLDPEGYTGVEELQGALDRYRAFYNHERPHQGIGGLVPADRFYGMAQPLNGVWQKLKGWGPEQGIFLTANLLGRRLVLAGPRPDQLRILWDDQIQQLAPPTQPAHEQPWAPLAKRNVTKSRKTRGS